MDSNCLLVTSFEFSKHYIRSFLQILYHSITMKVVAIDIQSLEAVIQDVFLYHSSITSETLFPIPASHSIILFKKSA